jgi:hypothetical protein
MSNGQKGSYSGSSGHAARNLSQGGSSMILQCRHRSANKQMGEGSWAARKPSGSRLCASFFRMLVPTSPDMICKAIAGQNMWLGCYAMASWILRIP